jgi:NADPH2:quinone reductase
LPPPSRSGFYKLPLPFVPGQEAAGVVEAVGSGVTGLAPGDRVAYCTAVGAYCEKRVIAADKLVKLPDGIEDRTAAAVLHKGLTAQYLLKQTIEVKAGDTILVHAAAGGVGVLLSQWAKFLGARVIGTVGSEDKAQLARDMGCDHVLVYGREDFAPQVRAWTSGRGVRVVYDGVGKDTFDGSLDCLEPRGMLVSFGQSSGAVGPFDILKLSAKGSLYLTRPTLASYAHSKETLRAMAEDLFDVVRRGVLRTVVPQSFALREAAAAHRALAGRQTTGSTVLVP